MKYTIYWTDNWKCKNWGEGKDTFTTDTYEFDNDKDALLIGVSIQEEEDAENVFEELDDVSEEELKRILSEVDVSSGAPVVFWIKRGPKKIYDTGMTRRDWNS